MVSLAILATLCGAVLGLRFKILVLVPVITAALLLLAGGGLALGAELSRIAFAVLVTGVALQVGFLGGAGLRFFLVAARLDAGRQPAGATASSRAVH